MDESADWKLNINIYVLYIFSNKHIYTYVQCICIVAWEQNAYFWLISGDFNLQELPRLSAF